MALNETQKKQVVLRWARAHNMVLCNREALHSMVKIINDLALGACAHIDQNGSVKIVVKPEYDYAEMMGIKAIVENDDKYLKPIDEEDMDYYEED